MAIGGFGGSGVLGLVALVQFGPPLSPHLGLGHTGCRPADFDLYFVFLR